MYKTIVSAFAALLVLLLTFGGGYFYGSKKEPVLKIITETKTEYKTTKVPMTPAELEAAAKSSIEITGSIRQNWIESTIPILSFKTKSAENWFDVRATDGYKQSDKSFKVGVSGDGKWNYAIYAVFGAVAGAGLYAILK